MVRKYFDNKVYFFLMCELTSEIYLLWKMLKLILVEMYVD
jgi:hypothetical protein